MVYWILRQSNEIQSLNMGVKLVNFLRSYREFSKFKVFHEIKLLY